MHLRTWPFHIGAAARLSTSTLFINRLKVSIHERVGDLCRYGLASRALPDAIHWHKLHRELAIENGLSSFSTKNLILDGHRCHKDGLLRISKLSGRGWSWPHLAKPRHEIRVALVVGFGDIQCICAVIVLLLIDTAQSSLGLCSIDLGIVR